MQFEWPCPITMAEHVAQISSMNGEALVENLGDISFRSCQEFAAISDLEILSRCEVTVAGSVSEDDVYAGLESPYDIEVENNNQSKTPIINKHSRRMSAPVPFKTPEITPIQQTATRNSVSEGALHSPTKAMEIPNTSDKIIRKKA